MKIHPFAHRLFSLVLIPLLAAGLARPAQAAPLAQAQPLAGQNLLAAPLASLLVEDFSDNSAGWTLDAEWQIGPAQTSACQATHNPDPAEDHTPGGDNGVAGIVIGGCASTALHPFHYLTSPVINASVSGPLMLEFYRWLNSDYSPYMVNRVEVFDGAAWNTIWLSGGSPGIADNAWLLQQFDITAYKNANLQVRFSMSVGAGGAFNVSSWNIDDVRVYNIPDYAALLDPTAASQSGDPGVDLDYPLTLTNDGVFSDTFSIGLSGNIWPAAAPSSLGPLAPGQSAVFTVTVSVPAAAAGGEQDALSVTALSQGGPGDPATAVLTSTANNVYGLLLDPPSAAQSGNPNTLIDYQLALTNTANTTDTFSTAVVGFGWTVFMPAALGPLAAGEGLTFTVQVLIPASAGGGDSNLSTIQVTSDGSGLADTSLLTTSANSIYSLQLFVFDSAKSGDPGSSVAYEVFLINQGNAPDSYDTDLISAWTANAPAVVGPLGAGEFITFSVTVDIPPDAPAGSSDSADLTVTSQADPSQSKNKTLVSSANLLYGIQVSPASAAQSGDPGVQVHYALTVTNTTNQNDQFFDLSLGVHDWTVAAPSVIGPFAIGESQALTVSVDIPPSAAPGDTDSVTLSFFPQGEPQELGSATLTTSANAVYAPQLTPASAAQSGDVGTSVVYTLQAANLGSAADSFDIHLSGNLWPASAPASLGPLAPGASAALTVTVDIPAGASGGESDSLSVSLTSQGDGGKTAGAALTTSANPRYALQLTPASAAQSGEAGTSVAYALQVTNQGNTADSFDITLGGNLWPASAPASLGPLAPGASAVLTVTVDIPAEASGGDSDSLSVNLASQGDGGQTASAALTTTANPRYALQLTPASAAQSGETGTNVTYALQVTNQGNASDSFSVSLAGSAWSSSAPSNLGPLAAGASQTLTVTVTIPANASAGETDALQVSLASQGDGAQTAQALLTTTANPRFGLALLAHTAAQSAAPGETLSYTLTITNTGNGSDTFTISLGGQTWAGSAPGSLTLAAGQSASFQVQVTIPSSAANGESDTLNVTVSSQGDPSQSGSAVLVSTALRAGTRLALPVIFK